MNPVFLKRASSLVMASNILTKLGRKRMTSTSWLAKWRPQLMPWAPWTCGPHSRATVGRWCTFFGVSLKWEIPQNNNDNQTLWGFFDYASTCKSLKSHTNLFGPPSNVRAIWLVHTPVISSLRSRDRPWLSAAANKRLCNSKEMLGTTNPESVKIGNRHVSLHAHNKCVCCAYLRFSPVLYSFVLGWGTVICL